MLNVHTYTYEKNKNKIHINCNSDTFCCIEKNISKTTNEMEIGLIIPTCKTYIITANIALRKIFSSYRANEVEAGINIFIHGNCIVIHLPRQLQQALLQTLSSNMLQAE